MHKYILTVCTVRDMRRQKRTEKKNKRSRIKMKRNLGEVQVIENEEWTEVNRYSKSTNERGASVVGLLSLSCNSTRDFCSALAAVVGPVQNIFSSFVHYFNSFVPVTQQARQAVVLDRLSLSTCLWEWRADRKTK